VSGAKRPPGNSRTSLSSCLSIILIISSASLLLQEFAEERILGGAIQQVGHTLACSLTDRPVCQKFFHLSGEWAVIMLLRSPGLALMYSAAIVLQPMQGGRRGRREDRHSTGGWQRLPVARQN
jgi:hypothetical protein